MAQSDRMHRCYTFGYTGAYAKSWVTALNGYFDLEAYIYATPGHLMLAGVTTILIHTLETLQAYPSAH